MSLAPIALILYNRLAHTRRVVESLAGNQLARDSDLVVFSDGPRTPADVDAVAHVREYARCIRGFRSVRLIERERNLGLAESIITAVTELVEHTGRIIVLEDDLVSSPYFLMYLNAGLDLYADEPSVASIHAYVYPVRTALPDTFFLKGADCWGWATWKDRWAIFERNGSRLLAELRRRQLTYEFDFDGSYPYTRMLEDQIAGRNDSWAIRWYASAFLADMVTLYPGRSLVHNIGNDGGGTHGEKSRRFDVQVRDTPVELRKRPPTEDATAKQAIASYFRGEATAAPAARAPRRWHQRIGRLFHA